MNAKFLIGAAFACASFHTLLIGFEENDGGANTPWFTGPLLAPSSTALPKGHVVIQPYVFCTHVGAVYDNNWHIHSIPQTDTISTQMVTIIGLTERMDIQITPISVFNRSQGKSSGQFADLPVSLDYQLVEYDKKSWFPSVKLTLREIFPTGKYQRLDPRNHGTDSSGGGSFGTNLACILHNEYHIEGIHYISTRFGTSITFFTPTNLSGFNNYGGGFGTHGKIRPGCVFTAIFSFEYSFTQQWAFAMDTLYVHRNRDRFSGKSGFLAPGIPATVGGPSSEQISFAPAIEYNFTKQFGILGGVWFSAWGRNSTKFVSGVFSAIYNY